MLSVKGVFTQEANIEADRVMREKFNLLNIYGANTRKTTNEGAHALYLLTQNE